MLSVATCGLVPGQGTRLFGAEILATGLFVCGLTSRIQLGARAHPHPQERPVWRAIATLAPGLAFVACGSLLLAGSTRAIYLLAPGTIVSFASGVFNAWVLLIEIQR